MPFVEVNIAEGRTPEQLRALINEVTHAVHRSLDAPLPSVRVVVREIPTTLWAAGDVTLAEKAAGSPGTTTTGGSMSTDDDLDVLTAKQAIRELVYRIARGVDRADPALIVSAFHEDGTDDHGSYQGPAAGFAEWATSFPMERSQHAIANVLSEVDGDSARAETYFTAQHNWPVDGEMMQVMAGGRYLDTFERRHGVWKLTHRHAVYDWEHIAPLREQNGSRTDGTRVWGERGTLDASYAFFTGGPFSASGG